MRYQHVSQSTKSLEESMMGLPSRGRVARKRIGRSKRATSMQTWSIRRVADGDPSSSCERLQSQDPSLHHPVVSTRSNRVFDWDDLQTGTNRFTTRISWVERIVPTWFKRLTEALSKIVPERFTTIAKLPSAPRDQLTSAESH